MTREELEKKVRHIEIQSRKAVLELLAGEYKSSFKGSGIDFEDIRTYEHGDDVRGIDWNVTARTGRVHVKQFMEERELSLFFLIDVSASGDFGSGTESKNEAAARIFALLAFAAAHNNDTIGLILFSDQLELYIKPGKGRKHLLHMVDAILSFKPQNKGTSIKAAIDFFNKIRRKRAVVFLLSDFIDNDYQDNLRFAARQHDLICLRLCDVRENQLPESGIFEIADAESGSVSTLDCSNPSLREQLAQKAQDLLLKQEAFFLEIDADYLPVTVSGDYLQNIITFFRQRRDRSANARR